MSILYRMGFTIAWTVLSMTAFAQRPFPYALSWNKEGPAAGLIVLSLTSYAVHDNKRAYTAQDVYNLNPSSVNGFDRAATHEYSTGADHLRTYMLAGTGVAGAISLPALVYMGSRAPASPAASSTAASPWAAPAPAFWRRCTVLGVMYAEGLAFNLGANEWAKKMVDRPRPYAYNNSLTYAERTQADYRSSFYSNTTALQWYTAGFIVRVVSDLCPESPYKYLIWGGAFAYSAVEGYLGVRSGQHFPTDVLAGALVGGVTGVLLPGWHRTTTRSGTKKDRSFSVFPGFGFAGTPQLCLVTHF